MHAHPFCSVDQRGSEGITVLRNLSCRSSSRGPFLVTVTRGMPFCRVQVFIMAVRSRCSPANRYCGSKSEINTCNKHRANRSENNLVKRVKFLRATPREERSVSWCLNVVSLHSWRPVRCYSSVFLRWSPPLSMSEKQNKMSFDPFKSLLSFIQITLTLIPTELSTLVAQILNVTFPIFMTTVCFKSVLYRKKMNFRLVIHHTGQHVFSYFCQWFVIDAQQHGILS